MRACFALERKEITSLFNIQPPRELTMHSFKASIAEIAERDHVLLGIYTPRNDITASVLKVILPTRTPPSTQSVCMFDAFVLTD